MLDFLWLIPALPFAAFLTLALAGGRLPRAAVTAIGIAPVGVAFHFAMLIGTRFAASPPPEHAVTQVLWTWMRVGDFAPGITLHLDALSVVMMLVVSLVGFIILMYSAEFMGGEEGYSRFFAYMNLFIGAMLTLVLAGDLLLLYLGWEGVGLCSYLLIGFWHKDPANGRAARKAFLVTRVGDAALAVGLFLIFHELGTLNIADAMAGAGRLWAPGCGMAIAAAALLLAGALGKSAQLPLQTWLPDAMAGPTPVSALIHAATMVTAGVYLIARTNAVFTLAPPVQTAVAVIGAATLLLAGFSALTQRDIKRVLAYSTMSQIGYMFLALGVGAWSAAIFHFMTHAAFKALLFLGAGVVILAVDHEHDMLKMGGLRRKLPVTFWTFLIGAASLAGLPLVTAGFYSKDLILWQTWSSPLGGPWLWAAGFAGALLTALYAFRMVFLVFFGQAKTEVVRKPRGRMTAALLLLAPFAVAAGFVQLPESLGHVSLFSNFMESALPATATHAADGMELKLQVGAALACLTGIALAWLFFLRRAGLAARVVKTPLGAALHRFWFAGWGFDAVYDTLLVRPFVWAARANKRDFVDAFYNLVAMFTSFGHFLLSLTQTGRVRWYAAGIALGAVVVIGIVVFL